MFSIHFHESGDVDLVLIQELFLCRMFLSRSCVIIVFYRRFAGILRFCSYVGVVLIYDALIEEEHCICIPNWYSF